MKIFVGQKQQGLPTCCQVTIHPLMNGVGSKGCKVNVERTGEKKDLYMSSEEPGESSQASALEFVDQFLSLNKIDVSPEIGIKKTFLEKSLPVLSKKRSQSLITRTKFRKLEVSKSGTFDWTDTDQHGNDDVFSKRANTTFEFVALKQIPEMEDDKSERLDTEGGRSSGNEHEQKEELVGLEKEIAVSNQSDSGYFVSIGKETCKMEQVSKMNFKNSTVEEFNDLHAESPDQQLEKSGTGRDTPDMIDVGFPTQMAAEAMEALSHVPFAGCTALDADQGPSNIADDYPKGVKMGKPRSEHASIPPTDFSGLGGIATKSMLTKRTARISVNSNNEEPESWMAMETKVRKDASVIAEQFDCTNSANAKESSGRRSPRLIVHEQVDKTVSWNNK